MPIRPSASVRLARIRELLKRQLGEIVRRELPAELSVLTSLNDVFISKDLKTASVFVGVIGLPDLQQRVVQRLNRDRVHYQELIAGAVILRQTPRLRFLLDTSVQRGQRVLSILDEIERTDPTPPQS
jgi:ribosome-binding factor A